MFREFVIFVTIGIVLYHLPATKGKSLDDLISEVFNDRNVTEDIINNERERMNTPKPTVPSTNRPIYNSIPTTLRTTTLRTPTFRTTLSTTTFTPIDPTDGPNPCSVGECTPYYLCPNGTIITDGEGVLDVRLGAEDDPEPERHPCPQFFDTCCLEKGDEPQILPVERKEGCGWRNLKGIGFQIRERSNEAQYAEFPWTTAIMIKESTPETILNVYQCAGALIHPSVVLTAAHCVAERPISKLLIRAGEWDTQTKDEPFPHQDRELTEIEIHKQYKRSNLINDIALLFLTEPVKLIENVNTACLPPADAIFDNKRCFATGWGKDKFGRIGAYQAILKKVELPVVSNQKCQQVLRKTRLGKNFNLNSSFMCAGGELGIDTCTGDGGAPLLCESPAHHGRYYTAGLVSWGIGCNEGHPGVYVNVPRFARWINEQFERRKLDKSYYQLQLPQKHQNNKKIY